MKDYLRVLKVKADASDKEIKDSYRRLKREYEQKKQKNKLIKLEEAYLAYLEQKKEEVKENKKEKDIEKIDGKVLDAKKQKRLFIYDIVVIIVIALLVQAMVYNGAYLESHDWNLVFQKMFANIPIAFGQHLPLIAGVCLIIDKIRKEHKKNLQNETPASDVKIEHAYTTGADNAEIMQATNQNENHKTIDKQPEQEDNHLNVIGKELSQFYQLSPSS